MVSKNKLEISKYMFYTVEALVVCTLCTFYKLSIPRNRTELKLIYAGYDI